MTYYIIVGILIAIAIAIAAWTIAESVKRAKERQQIKDALKHEQEKNKKTIEIVEAANRTKADARTGDHSADFKYMADKLHDYAHR